jgi:hypothetical protein
VGEKLQGLAAQHQLERLLRLNELNADIEAGSRLNLRLAVCRAMWFNVWISLDRLAVSTASGPHGTRFSIA